MSDNEIKAAVHAKYREKYPNLVKADVKHIARGLLLGQVVVVDCEEKTDPSGAGSTAEAWEEMCYVTEDGSVKIFDDTKALTEGLLSAAGESESIQSLRNQRTVLQKRKRGVRWAQFLAAVVGVLSLTSTTILLAVFGAKSAFVWALAIYSAFNFVFALLAGMLVRDAESDFQEVEYKIDLQLFKVDDREKRAEKILRLNDLQLRRYYDSSLRQNGWIFWLGIFCIILGVGISGLTLLLVKQLHGSPEHLGEQVVIAAIGAVGSLLANYVAVIYLKMHASVSGAMVTFHERLVATHQTLFGNLVASRIADDKLRWDTLSKIALNISNPDFRAAHQESIQKN